MSQVGSTCRADQALRCVVTVFWLACAHLLVGCSYIYRFLPGFGLGNGLIALSFLPQLPLMEVSCDHYYGINTVLTPFASSSLPVCDGELFPLQTPHAPYQATDMPAAGTNIVYMAVRMQASQRGILRNLSLARAAGAVSWVHGLNDPS